MSDSYLDKAKEYRKAGLSPIPTDPKTKVPTVKWKKFQQRQPTEDELTKLFANAKALGIVTGNVSGDLEILDFDHKAELYPAWAEIVEAEASGLLARLVIQKTQSDGRHVGYRCPGAEIPGNTIFAQRGVDVTKQVLTRLSELGIKPDDIASVKKALPAIQIEVGGKKQVPKLIDGKFIVIITLIETRGEGGQFLAAPSPGYELLQGDFTAIPVITAKERQILVNAALALNTYLDPNKIEGTGDRRSKGAGRPGDAFNETGNVAEMLTKHRWVQVRGNDIYQHWRRPGKAIGQSASLINDKIFYVFSQNAPPFEAGKGYSPFAVCTLLEHYGDYTAAAQELSKQGYGQQKSQDGDPADPSGTSLYFIEDGALKYNKDTKNGPIPITLTNFTAEIVGEVVTDDGAETKTIFNIKGADRHGKPYPAIEVPTHQFSGLGWITANWGNGPVVFAGFAIKDHVRCAIQVLSGEVPRQTVFGHLGWRKINGGWGYLHCGGAIGAGGPVAGVEVNLGNAQMQEYQLPPIPPPEKLLQAVKASLELRFLATPQITYPLLCAVYRAPLGECAPIDLSLFLAGNTGCQKTELSALAQAHYGPGFNGRNLPSNWSTTANALEYQAFQAKDAILTVDDFAPRGTVNDIQRFHKEADRLLRAQGNRSGRGRMRPDGSLRPSYYPRGLIISSGEDIPTGQSVRARTLILEIKRGNVDLAKLTMVQQAAADGLFGQAMAGYLQYLAGRMDDLKHTLPIRQRELRTMARREGAFHDRTPEIWASLILGFEQFLTYALEIGAITEAERQELFKECWEALRQASLAQETHQRSEDPVGRFLALLGAAIASGKAHVADAKTLERPKSHAELWGWREKTVGTGNHARNEWQPQGDCLGWLDNDDLLLEPDAAYAAVQRLGRDQGTSLPIAQRTLWKRMAERGLLASREHGQNRNQVRWHIGDGRRRVIHLKADVISHTPSNPDVDTDADTDKDADNGPWTDSQDRFSSGFEKTVHTKGLESQQRRGPGPNGPNGPFVADIYTNSFIGSARPKELSTIKFWNLDRQREAAEKLKTSLALASLQDGDEITI